MRTQTGIALAAAALIAASMTVADAAARDREREHEHEEAHERERDARRARAGRASMAIDPTYAKECGSCHVAYPPRLLPAASWRELMAGLDRHFGQHAELEPEVRAAIERWLVASAGPEAGAAGAQPPLRITTLPWFRHEHDEVPARAVARPAIRSMANCTACHPGAESWDFDEDRAKIPR
jgi:Dihaem cytochrome c